MQRFEKIEFLQAFLIFEKFGGTVVITNSNLLPFSKEPMPPIEIMETELSNATKVLQKALKTDPELYYAYQANIAMAFWDELKKAGIIDYYEGTDFHAISNDGAKRFLDLFIR